MSISYYGTLDSQPYIPQMGKACYISFAICIRLPIPLQLRKQHNLHYTIWICVHTVLLSSCEIRVLFGSKYTLILDVLTEGMLVAENFESVVAF